MVSEVRTLVFSNDELVQALEAFMDHREMAFPTEAQAIVTLTNVEDGNELAAILTYDDAGSSQISFTGQDVGTALVLFCMRQAIPLPRTHHKSVEWRGDNAALVIRHQTREQFLEMQEF